MHERKPSSTKIDFWNSFTSFKITKNIKLNRPKKETNAKQQISKKKNSIKNIEKFSKQHRYAHKKSSFFLKITVKRMVCVIERWRLNKIFENSIACVDHIIHVIEWPFKSPLSYSIAEKHTHTHTEPTCN